MSDDQLLFPALGYVNFDLKCLLNERTSHKLTIIEEVNSFLPEWQPSNDDAIHNNASGKI